MKRIKMFFAKMIDDTVMNAINDSFTEVDSEN